MQHEAYHAEGIVKMITALRARVEALRMTKADYICVSDLEKRVEALEKHKLYIGPYSLTLPKPEGGDYAGLGPKALSSTHQVPVKQPTGHWVCDACYQVYGRNGEYLGMTDHNQTYFCRDCGEEAVTWHSEPKAYPDSAENEKSTACELAEGIADWIADNTADDTHAISAEESSTVQAGTEPITSQLKPCEECGRGGKTVRVNSDNRALDKNKYVRCGWCGKQTGYYSTEAEAIAAWNRRAADDDDSVNALQYDLVKAKEEIDRLKAENERLKECSREASDRGVELAHKLAAARERIKLAMQLAEEWREYCTSEGPTAKKFDKILDALKGDEK